MESDAPPAALYDFLYKDSERIASYYAQIFSGRIASREHLNANRDSVEHSGKVNLQVAGADTKHIQETTQSAKTVIDPHDALTTDVLAYLVENGHLHTNVVEAHHGQLIVTLGTLLFVERSLLELTSMSFDLMIQQEKSKPSKQQNHSAIQTMETLKAFLKNLVVPSSFLMRTPEGRDVVGYIKDAFLSEPISSYYYKHGGAGLSDVHLIGIKEIPSPAFTLSDTHLMGVAQGAVQALHGMVFPSDAIRVTPIALFRKLI